jgi:hypothetical protein
MSHVRGTHENLLDWVLNFEEIFVQFVEFLVYIFFYLKIVLIVFFSLKINYFNFK